MAGAVITPDEVRAAADRLEGAAAEDVLAWAVERFAGRAVLTCSWQQQSSVLIHMTRPHADAVRIADLDTELLFPETYATRDRLVERYGLTLETFRAEQTPAEQEATLGPALWERDPDRCCFLRKVLPLERALAGSDAWITGIRRAQSATRADARPVEWDEARGVVKVQPLVAWSDEDVKGYLFAHDIPYNPLHDQGYPSIGCMPCTRPVAPGDDPRSGRWAGTGKTECGLHLPRAV